jgi:hypothetical protein
MPGVAHVLEGVLDGFALGIEERLLGDDDSGLHEDGCRNRIGRSGTLEDHPGCPRGFLGTQGLRTSNPGPWCQSESHEALMLWDNLRTFFVLAGS